VIDLGALGAGLGALLAPGWTLTGPTLREGRWVVGARRLEPSGREDEVLEIETADLDLERAFGLLEARIYDLGEATV
jgi:hypothetical protein